MIEEIRRLKQEMEQLKTQVQAQGQQGAAPAQEEEEEEDTNPSWADVLGTATKAVAQPGALAMVALLPEPPSLEMLKHNAQNITKYQGVPPTPGPRKNRMDMKLFQAQLKMENALHCLIHFMETRQDVSLGQVAAWSRSAFEDLHQTRRGWYAGRQAYKLDPRPDDDRPRLLTQDEQAKIKPPPKPKPRPARYNWGANNAYPPPTAPAPFPFHKPQGKGKGKGKGKST